MCGEQKGIATVPPVVPQRHLVTEIRPKAGHTPGSRTDTLLLFFLKRENM